MIGINLKRIIMLLQTPIVIVNLILVTINAYFGKNENAWIKTRRVQ
jgi:hypothetical protein